MHARYVCSDLHTCTGCVPADYHRCVPGPAANRRLTPSSPRLLRAGNFHVSTHSAERQPAGGADFAYIVHELRFGEPLPTSAAIPDASFGPLDGHRALDYPGQYSVVQGRVDSGTSRVSTQ